MDITRDNIYKTKREIFDKYNTKEYKEEKSKEIKEESFSLSLKFEPKKQTEEDDMYEE